MLRQWGQEILNAIRGASFPGLGSTDDKTLVLVPFSIAGSILLRYIPLRAIRAGGLASPFQGTVARTLSNSISGGKTDSRVGKITRCVSAGVKGQYATR